MATITNDYINNLPAIYRDVLAAYPQFAPTRKVGHGLSFQSLYSALDEKWSLAQIRMACEQMAMGGAMEIKNGIFAHPTPLGEELIAAVTGDSVPQQDVPPFDPPIE